METTSIANRSVFSRLPGNRHLWEFAFLWALTFALYLPAAKAGWVVDAAGWLHNIRELSFLNYVNNAQSGIPSLYQFTQLTTYIFYKAFNANPYLWHTLMVSMHAVNAYLLYRLCAALFTDSGIIGAGNIALAGATLFIVCPHVSETIVWEAAYHYLQGMLLIMLVLTLLQRFHYKPKKKYAVLAGIIFFCSTYSLEIFYLTPWFVLTFALYYRYVLNYDKSIFSKSVKWFFIPQMILFAIHLVVLKTSYGYIFAHIGDNIAQPFSNYIYKPPRYIFHILFFGRFFPLDARRQVYSWLGDNAGLIVFYNILVLVCLYIIDRFTKMTAKGKAATLLFVWASLTQAILLPLAFPDLFWVNFDRYTYFLDAFLYMLVAVLFSYITKSIISCSLFAAYMAVNIYFTVRVNLGWKHAAYITNRLLREFPNPGNKIVLLLNPPQNLYGIPMIGAEKDGQFKMMYKVLVNNNMPNKIYEVAAYNMNTREDGAHVLIHNDTIVTVTLNQWGTWWWYEGQGATSYENEDYKLYMRDMGHWYDLQLKKPVDQYLLLYNVGDRWKVVDINKKNEPQY